MVTGELAELASEGRPLTSPSVLSPKSSRLEPAPVPTPLILPSLPTAVVDPPILTRRWRRSSSSFS